MRGMEVRDTGEATAQENMNLDAAFLADLDPTGHPVMHHYSWKGKCATFGYFVKPECYLDLAAVEEQRLDLGKRPTGGGIIFHDTDLAFSFFLPSKHPAFSLNTLDNYRFVNEMVIQALRRFQGQGVESDLLQVEPIPLDESARLFCMAKPTKYDVIVGGRKVGGAAQRRVHQGLLHQGSISLSALPEALLEKVLLPSRVLEAMRMHTFSLLGEVTAKELQEARVLLQRLLTDAAKDCLEQSS